MSQQGLGSECQGSGLPKVGHQWGLRVFIWDRFHLGRWSGIHKSDTVTLGRVGPLSSLPRCRYLPHRVRMLTGFNLGVIPPLALQTHAGGGGLPTRAWVTLWVGKPWYTRLALLVLCVQQERSSSE